MEIYVCFEDYDYDGMSQPIAAFKTEEEAKQWVVENKSIIGKNDYVKLVVEE
jgi:hypothetical protein